MSWTLYRFYSDCETLNNKKRNSKENPLFKKINQDVKPSMTFSTEHKPNSIVLEIY